MDDYDVLRKAVDAMGKSLNDSRSSSITLFIGQSMQWLAKELGDVHIEYREYLGWQVGTCFEDEYWSGWIEGPDLPVALAKAVLAVKEKLNGNQYR